MNIIEFTQAVLQDGGRLWDGWTQEELSHAIRETTWCGEDGFQAQNGFYSWQWFPFTGWTVQAGRGVAGVGETLAEANAAEEAAYDASFEQFSAR